jgi:hypothetical protein
MANPDVLIIDSVGMYGTPIIVACSKGGESEPRLVGDESPAYAGNLRSSVLTEKRVESVTTIPVATAIKDSIKARVARRRQVYVSGELFANVATLCSFRIIGCEMQDGEATWILQMSISEV